MKRAEILESLGAGGGFLEAGFFGCGFGTEPLVTFVEVNLYLAVLSATWDVVQIFITGSIRISFDIAFGILFVYHLGTFVAEETELFLLGFVCGFS